jgi:signal transduction histidine kinase
MHCVRSSNDTDQVPTPSHPSECSSQKARRYHKTLPPIPRSLLTLQDITIKIADEGGGIARSVIPRIWTYMYTTAESQDLDPDFNKSDFKAPMAGFGYGLPLSRLYARYFGGDLRLESVDGHGTDVYMNLNRLSSSREPLM